jgi:threonine synthase
VDQARYDLWRYAALFDPEVPPGARITLGEGWTPAVELPGLAAALDLERLVLKREDLNPGGSHKARGLCYQIALESVADPVPPWLTISSSGNAAIAAAAYAARAGLRLAAFLAPDTPAEKVGLVARLGAAVFLSPRATSLAQELAAERGLPNLRPSVHPHGATGFQTIGWEILETVAPVEALFVFAASAGGLVGLGRAFERGAEVVAAPWRPALQVVQGCGAHPIAGPLDSRPPPTQEGRVGALGARKTRRLGEATRLVRASGGAGWVITDDEAFAAARLLAGHGVLTSLEGAAALAAAARAAREVGCRSALVVLTGAHRGSVDDPPVAAAGSGRVRSVADLSEVLAVLDSWPLPQQSGATDRSAGER